MAHMLTILLPPFFCGVVLSKSFSELQQAVAEGPEVFLSVAERLSEAIQRLEAQLGSARSAGTCSVGFIEA
jgi:hypothetical protein